ncbi:tyrosine-type recombinase/integrase [Xanthobacter autotrophicus]|uniref:tyrosine-type recombinase/integrase n=1 Tax=Xanthobacter autotrophicus TaxID=280 RepID=UPI0037284EEC
MPDPEFKLGRLKDRWVVSWWEDGARKRFRLEASTRQEAERAKASFVIGLSRHDDVTVEELWTAYLKEKEGRRVVRSMNFEWKFLGPTFGHLEARHITVELCREYVRKRRKLGKRGAAGGETADGTIWTEMGHLRTVLTWAADKKLIDHAPKIERPPKPKPKERYLTRREAHQLLDAAAVPHIRLAIILTITTAARIGAVLDLTWDRVDFVRAQIKLARPDTTTRKGRATVPINATLMAALREARTGALTDHVIEWNGKAVASIKTGFEAAVSAGGLEGVTPHVLRHTAAVWMAEDGVDMEEIAQYLGHEDSRITRKVYARFSPGHLQKAAASLDFAIPQLKFVK